MSSTPLIGPMDGAGGVSSRGSSLTNAVTSLISIQAVVLVLFGSVIPMGTSLPKNKRKGISPTHAVFSPSAFYPRFVFVDKAAAPRVIACVGGGKLTISSGGPLGS